MSDETPPLRSAQWSGSDDRNRFHAPSLDEGIAAYYFLACHPNAKRVKSLQLPTLKIPIYGTARHI